MPNDTMEDAALEAVIMDRAEGINAMVAILQLGIHGYDGMLPSEKTINAYLQLMSFEMDILCRDLQKIDWTKNP